eukprot:CAMPEP_0181197830 /NCGR_PEP_ID=MMETSP1096-20121128/16262_1 /TAXON_ID=156174 ORGANISM="Chrysochromulina ericina, Strain CCMP281" /NCGR_SAMPLE_ID=MMETSP1096 /ASSEMBLY_ACC=CAM_ASM_000453 /LENGTH=105 /DNA_ID=CAMNT_0023287791 /DNA_START=421 /DNA_END=738 /DNA_ORIENTATION=-
MHGVWQQHSWRTQRAKPQASDALDHSVLAITNPYGGAVHVDHHVLQRNHLCRHAPSGVADDAGEDVHHVLIRILDLARQLQPELLDAELRHGPSEVCWWPNGREE